MMSIEDKLKNQFKATIQQPKKRIDESCKLSSYKNA